MLKLLTSNSTGQKTAGFFAPLKFSPLFLPVNMGVIRVKRIISLLGKLTKIFFVLLVLSILVNYLFGYSSTLVDEPTFLRRLYFSSILSFIPCMIGILISCTYKLLLRKDFRFLELLIFGLWLLSYIIPFLEVLLFTELQPL